MKVACVDTHIIIWGVKEEADPGQEEMIPRAKALLKKLDESKTPIVLPTVVLAEVLMRVPKNEHAAVIGKLEKRFILTPFDAQTSSCFADIWFRKKETRKEEPTCTRDHLKADMMIVASAITSGSDHIFSCDDHVPKISENEILCSDIPVEETQLELGLPVD